MPTHTKKHGKSYHGYKLSICVDVKHKFIRKITTGTASEHDSRRFDEVIDEGNTSRDVYADRGYPGALRSEMLKVLGYREHIQRKAKPNQRLSDCQKGRNKRIAKIRVRVEHPFAQMRHMGGKIIRTIGQARATVAMTMMATCYNLKRLAQPRPAGHTWGTLGGHRGCSAPSAPPSASSFPFSLLTLHHSAWETVSGGKVTLKVNIFG